MITLCSIQYHFLTNLDSFLFLFLHTHSLALEFFNIVFQSLLNLHQCIQLRFNPFFIFLCGCCCCLRSFHLFYLVAHNIIQQSLLMIFLTWLLSLLVVSCHWSWLSFKKLESLVIFVFWKLFFLRFSFIDKPYFFWADLRCNLFLISILLQMFRHYAFFFFNLFNYFLLLFFLSCFFPMSSINMLFQLWFRNKLPPTFSKRTHIWFIFLICEVAFICFSRFIPNWLHIFFRFFIFIMFWILIIKYIIIWLLK
jgi:hypothetical protein